jgi:tetratricopeptide (TPR) repeat protein
LLLLVVLAIGQAAALPTSHSLESYLRLAAAYGSADRASSVREIREWPAAVIRAALADVRGRKLRVSSTSPDDVAIDTVEAAVLMHTEAGLLALREAKPDEAECHLKAAVSLFAWSRQEASRVRAQKQALLKVSKRGSTPDPAQYDVQPRITRALFSLALASGALAAGEPNTARAFAEDARRAAPFDPDVQLVFGAVAEGLGEVEWMRGNDAAASRWREEAARALAQAVSLAAGVVADPLLAQPASRGLEARLRLGRVALEKGWLPEARRCLEEAEAKTKDDRQRHLARLLLGRVAERQERTDEALAFYARALEAWPTSQATALAWAHCLERASGPAAARPLVARALDRTARSDSAAEPWRSYLFGPPGLAQAAFDRIRMDALGQ